MWLSDWLRRWFVPHTPPAARGAPSPEDSHHDSTYDDDATDETEIDPFNPFTEPVRLEIRDVFDLHAIAPREVELVVEEYLVEARRAGFRVVRIIHGKGIGVQRETVRTVLARTSFVVHFADAPPDAGGWGATIARLYVEDG
ncbi:MAG: Smr/MutS family protein [Pyrinomonadaceae bacterium]|nr:Smr/MutS family protein [Pyrinomonadaceae bacterium]